MIHFRRDKLRFILAVGFLIISISLVLRLLDNPELQLGDIMERSMGGENSVKLKPDHHNDGPSAVKCGLAAPCPKNDFAFKIASGAANVVGPQICFDGKIIIEKQASKNHPGITIVVIEEATGELIKTGSYNMWNGDVTELIHFVNSTESGSLVLMASYDDPATKLNEEARQLIAELGSAYISNLKFRDNWVFVGGKKTIVKASFEQHLKNERSTNKYEAWPEMIEMEGCIPRPD
ncbi:protein FAM3C [Triplophysa rosa]|uniref:ILEI/PANDER domain-containing protein n=1 Tax=Triplophysa rosa TaxID=992332 RepID=A0A9W7X0P9_TRIRA|nr:protein FAM3C [Triplophysa rosa]KAI7811987.1 hypothetical protein IRJ41_022261 [Triplophysa rosa]